MRIFLWVICILLMNPVFSQTEKEGIDYQSLTGLTLEDALKFLNTNHQINFSYNPDALEGIRINNVPESIKDTGSFLQWALTETELDFEYISNTYVIFPRSESEVKTSQTSTFSIKGRVLDKTTRESLPFATIVVPGTKITSTTNTDGKFSLMNIPSDTLTIKITYLGYMSLEIPLIKQSATAELLCELTSQERRLPQVQILAPSYEILEIDQRPGHLTFDPAKISTLPNLGENDVFSALRKLPGIRGGIDASSGLKIRGGASDQNLVMFDGITVYHVDHFYGFLSAFNTNVIKNIQIDKGGYTAKYGGRTSGVVDITGIDGNKVNPSLLVEVSSLSASVEAELPIVPNKASMVFSYRRSFTDFIQSGNYKNLFNNIYNSSIPAPGNSNLNIFDGSSEPDYVFSDLNAKVHFIPSQKDEIALSYYQGSDDLNMEFDGNTQNLRRISQDQTTWGNKGGSVKWSRKWNKQLFTYGNYGVSTYKSHLDAGDSYFFMNTDTLLSRIFYEQRNEVNDHTLRLDNTWDINSNSRLEFGYWNSRYEIKNQAQNQNKIIRDSTSTGRLQAVYAELTHGMGKWRISPGIRGSQFKDEFYLEPRLALTYSLNEAMSFKGAYGIFHQNIRRLNERSLYLSIPETWTLSGISTIPVLESNHYVLGVLYSVKDWQFDVEGYHKYETGTVDYLYPEFGFATGDISEFAIGGSRKILGLDALIKRAFRNQYILLTYTYLDSKSKYDDVNSGAYFTSSGTSTHELNLVYSYELRRWDFSAAFVVASGEAYTSVIGTYIITDSNGGQKQMIEMGDINSERLNTYNRLDLGMNYSIPLKRGVFQMGASVYNLLNTRVTKFIDYYQMPQEGSQFYNLGQRNIPSLGITPSIFIKLKI